jgi:hypothetical protein
MHNRASRTVHYARQDRLHDLGWSEVEIIDDLGCSTAGTVVRVGFERMVVGVGLDKVGAVAAWEVSWFTRNSRDWQYSSRSAGWSIPC